MKREHARHQLKIRAAKIAPGKDDLGRSAHVSETGARDETIPKPQIVKAALTLLAEAIPAKERQARR
jgi:hypothetical protein